MLHPFAKLQIYFYLYQEIHSFLSKNFDSVNFLVNFAVDIKNYGKKKNGTLVVLFNGFQKKTQKTPNTEIERARRLMAEYFDNKNK